VLIQQLIKNRLNGLGAYFLTANYTDKLG
jgi:hypothetical protein